jgi:hypothetical protein
MWHGLISYDTLVCFHISLLYRILLFSVLRDSCISYVFNIFDAVNSYNTRPVIPYLISCQCWVALNFVSLIFSDIFWFMYVACYWNANKIVFQQDFFMNQIIYTDTTNSCISKLCSSRLNTVAKKVLNLKYYFWNVGMKAQWEKSGKRITLSIKTDNGAVMDQRVKFNRVGI